MKHHLDKTIVGALEHIKKFQPERHPIFHTAIILSCLEELKDLSTVKKISQRGVNFLISQKSNTHGWNY